jgi:RimJ/RimL family protein N-acetyltransferase
MASRLILDNPARVFAFMRGLMPLNAVSGMQALGLEKDGALVAGIAFEGFNGHNIWGHLAATPGSRWMNRAFLHASFAYPFLQCGVQRFSAYVDASNLAARRLDEHLGFTPEATLRGAGSDGGDVIIYVMRREDCRYV